MPHIKQACFLPSPSMAIAHTEIVVLNGHRVARERNHLGSMSHMKIVERCSE